MLTNHKVLVLCCQINLFERGTDKLEAVVHVVLAELSSVIISLSG